MATARERRREKFASNKLNRARRGGVGEGACGGGGGGEFRTAAVTAAAQPAHTHRGRERHQ